MAVRNRRTAALVLIAFVLAGCGSSRMPDVVKIGLVAPFEGRYREIGSDIIPAVRLALHEWMVVNPDDVVVYELVAYDDMGDPNLAVEQAQKLAADPEVAVVIGHWRDTTTGAALPVYQAAGLPLVAWSTDDMGDVSRVWNLSPDQQQLTDAIERWAADSKTPVVPLVNGQPTIQLDIGQLVTTRLGAYATGTVVVGGPAWDISQFPRMAPERVGDNILFVSGLAVPGQSVDLPGAAIEAFVSSYRESSLGADPGPYAVTAYEAGWVALQIASGQLNGPVAGAATVQLTFDDDGRRQNPPIYLYRWASGSRQFEEMLTH